MQSNWRTVGVWQALRIPWIRVLACVATDTFGRSRPRLASALGVGRLLSNSSRSSHREEEKFGEHLAKRMECLPETEASDNETDTKYKIEADCRNPDAEAA